MEGRARLIFNFEKLQVWQLSRTFTSLIYNTVDSFPKYEQFAPSQQLRRASISVSANLAEGSARSSEKESSRFVEMAFGSLCEVVAELYLALDRGYITKPDFDFIYAESERIGKMLTRFRESIETSWIKKRVGS